MLFVVFLKREIECADVGPMIKLRLSELNF